MVRLTYLLILSTIGLFGGSANSATTDSPPKEIRQFLNSNCADCHVGEDSEAGFDLGSLRDTPGKINWETWTRIYDRVASGEMPPPEDSNIDQQQRRKFLKTTQNWISQK